MSCEVKLWLVALVVKSTSGPAPPIQPYDNRLGTTKLISIIECLRSTQSSMTSLKCCPAEVYRSQYKYSPLGAHRLYIFNT